MHALCEFLHVCVCVCVCRFSGVLWAGEWPGGVSLCVWSVSHV